MGSYGSFMGVLWDFVVFYGSFMEVLWEFMVFFMGSYGFLM